MKIMAIDYGDTRTGVAICDTMEILATPYDVIHEKKYLALAMQLIEIAEKEEVEQIVIGNPLHMNGSQGERSKKSKQLQSILKRKLKIEVVLMDERRTTVSAYAILDETQVFGKKRKNVVDAVAATIILETYLQKRKQEISLKI